MNDHSWLRTDEIQFICALLLCNHESNRLFHVLGPMITHQISIFYKSFQRAKEGTQTEKQKREYENNMDGILKYIDSRLDILQHKFLVFLCNVRHMHWVSVVVVNPFLVLEQEEQQQKENQDTVLGVTDFVGWCVLNSIQHNKEKEKMVSREPQKQKMRHQWEFIYF
jgi:Ulp1 protease family, C-terminal catalytic domain